MGDHKARSREVEKGRDAMVILRREAQVMLEANMGGKTDPTCRCVDFNEDIQLRDKEGKRI